MRDVPVAGLVAASLAPDLLDGAYVVAGIRSPDGLFSHTPIAVCILAIAVGGAAFARLRRPRGALVVAALVALHLLVDYVTGEKVLLPGHALVGFDLYRWPLPNFALEAQIVAGGWIALRRAHSQRGWCTRWSLPCASRRAGDGEPEAGA